MKIIVPMAGMGKRLRPHTLTTPKPLLPIAGKPIVQRLVEDIAAICKGKVEEIAFIIGDFGKETEQNLLNVASSLGAKGSIYYQEQPLGTAHAIFCAEPSLSGEIIVAFADTLFAADFTLDPTYDGTVWVKQVEDPRAFGVVKVDESGIITDFVEKPAEFVSDLAIIGIYYFNNGATLKSEIQYLLDNNIMEKGEYQLTNALENMKKKGMRFGAGKVDAWMDCGNKEALLDTNRKVLGMIGSTIHKESNLDNVTLIEPVFIGKGSRLSNVVIGPNVAIGENNLVENAVISESILMDNAKVKNAVISETILGKFSSVNGQPEVLNLGDYSSR